jgi:uncharacterized protein DUF4129
MWRRLAAAGAVLTVLGLIAIGLMRVTLAPPRPIPFEDPATAVPDAQPGAVFEYVLTVLSRLNTGQYQEARLLTGHLQKATVPSGLQSLFSEVTDALGKEGSLVEVVDRWIRDITALSQAGRTVEAQRFLAQLDLQVRRADFVFTELSGGTQDLRAGIQRELDANPAQQKAFDDLQRAAARIKGFLAVYRATSKTTGSVAAVGRLLPYETLIELDAPEAAYPGRLFEISGRVRERTPSPSGRHVNVELDGQPVAEIASGAIHVQFAMPDDIAAGLHRLQVEFPEQGRYRAARWTKTIQVSRITPHLEASSPTWLTVPGRFSISGSVASELGPLTGAAVRVSIAGQEFEKLTSESGGFQISGRLPVALNLGGPTDLSITVLPREPWFAPITEPRRLMTINLISVGALVAFLLVGMAIVLKQVNRRPLVGAPREAPKPAAEDVTQGRAAAALAQMRGSLAEELVAIYRRVLRRLELASGTQAEVTTTLREFVELLPLRTEGDTLWRLTVLAELALYSPHPVTPAQIEQARTLGMQLEGALSGAQ